MRTRIVATVVVVAPVVSTSSIAVVVAWLSVDKIDGIVVLRVVLGSKSLCIV